MNDSLSFSSSSTTHSSANPSNSNSLNRSLINSSICDDYLCDPSVIKRRSRSLICVTHSNKLRDELNGLKKVLKEKDNMIIKLADIRDRLESEIRELSACLFEQAYAMVNAAKEETCQANKLLNEANGKVDILEAEVKALKTLVITSTPSTPNKHLHPQLTLNNFITNTKSAFNISSASSGISLGSSGSSSANSSNQVGNNLFSTPKATVQSNLFKSQHKRTPSYNDVIPTKQTQQLNNLFPTSSSSINTQLTVSPQMISPTAAQQQNLTINEMDPIYFKEIVLWREEPNMSLEENSFLKRVYNEDILPCITFANKNLMNELLESVKTNCVCIEEISNATQLVDAMQVCSLSNVPILCQYKIKLNETSQWYFISKLCRNRIISVCDFFTYLRYIKDGLVKSENRDVYWNIIDLRKRMSLSRLGL